MIRFERDYELTYELRESWNQQIQHQVEEVMSDWEKWPLLENVGSQWTEAPPRIKRATKQQAQNGMFSDHASKVSEKANPGLRLVYHNQAIFLNARRREFEKIWRTSYQQAIWKRTRRAMDTLVKRFPFAEHFGFYWVAGMIGSVAWERLHCASIDAPFNEFNLTIVQAGFLPSGIDGSDWRTCRFLYF